MKIQSLLGVVTACALSLVSLSINASLLPRFDGLALYDSDRDITWIANGNLAASNKFGVSEISPGGVMSWLKAQEWMDNLNGENYLGFNDWRLPATLTPDTNCQNGNDLGINCSGSEMGHLYYTEYGTQAGQPISASAEFGNTFGAQLPYWSGDRTPTTMNYGTSAYIFYFTQGQQSFSSIGAGEGYALVVRDGDVSAVPVPAAAWLFGSGLLGLISVARKKT